MTKPLLRIAVTGGAGQIAYSLLFRIASGEVFGKDKDIALQILEVPAGMEALEGVKMELEDCAFPLLKEIVIGSDPKKIFKDAQWAILVGAKPRGPGMERGDLLFENGKIFVEQGQALNAVADSQVKVLVVGNPCNTNALITMNNAPRIPRTNFFAMTRLDQNRAAAQLSKKAASPVTGVSKMVIWGNHSSTQVPDFYNAEINSAPVTELIKESSWFTEEFVPTVQKRGAAIIKARGKSSAASAANAIVDTIHSLIMPTPKGETFSLGVCSDRNPYGITDNLIFSFPCRSQGQGDFEIEGSFKVNEFLKEKIGQTEKELIEEREAVTEMTTAKS